MKDIKALIGIIVNDYKEAKEDMKKNSPNTKWLMLLVVVLFVIAGLDVIIDEFKKTDKCSFDKSNCQIGIRNDDIKELECAAYRLNFFLRALELANYEEEERHPISKEMDECVSDFMETISEAKK